MKKAGAALMVIALLASLHAADKPDPNVVFEKTVRSFNTLDEASKFEELKSWGLLAPQERNHAAGKNLILLALKPTSFLKGDWASSLGLMGVQMLQCDLACRQGYQSLFASQLVESHGLKMYASSLVNNGILLSSSSKSILGRREAAIHGVGTIFFTRYSSCPANELESTNQYLKRALDAGLKVYLELSAKGYDDKTLKDTLNIAKASLDRDKVVNGDLELKELGPLQIHRDALAATIAQLKESGLVVTDSNFAFFLATEMSKRGLAIGDNILTPDDEKSFDVILKIIASDLTDFENK